MSGASITYSFERCDQSIQTLTGMRICLDLGMPLISPSALQGVSLGVLSYRLPITDYRLLNTEYWIPKTDYQLLFEYDRLLFTISRLLYADYPSLNNDCDYWILNTDYWLPITEYSRLTTNNKHTHASRLTTDASRMTTTHHSWFDLLTLILLLQLTNRNSQLTTHR